MPRPGFQHLQYCFAGHLRDPAGCPAPEGIEDRRLKIYRELFYNNVADTLASSFPVLRRISSDAAWHRRVRDFYARHRCTEPQFYRLAEEFLRFLHAGRGAHADDPPFLFELCHYEWVELALSVSPLELDAPGDGDDLIEGRVRVSPLAWLLVYEWPVHRIGPESLPRVKPLQPTYLLVNRDRRDEVRFLEVNAVTARLFNLLEQGHWRRGRDALRQLARELGHPQPQAVTREGERILRDLQARDILLGARPQRSG